MDYMNKESIEIKLGLWLYNRDVLGLIKLAFEFSFIDGETLGKKLYEEIFK